MVNTLGEQTSIIKYMSLNWPLSNSQYFSDQIKGFLYFMSTSVYFYPPDKPSVPSQPIIEKITADTATIAWTKPLSDGGAPIINYRVEMRSVGAYRWDVVNTMEKVTGTRYTARNLMDETDYEFRVSAENRTGLGPPSEPSRSAKYGEWFVSIWRSVYLSYYLRNKCIIQ